MRAIKTAVFVVFLVLSAPASAKDYALTVYGGYRDGGQFIEESSGQNLPLDGAGAISVAFDMPYDKTRQYQLFISHQRTAVSLTGSSITNRDELDLNITYAHFGGTNFFSGAIGKGPYVAGGIGATYFDPAEEFDGELRASMNLALGYQLPLSEALAVRFEARGYATLINSNGGFFCSGGCVISISGDTITQGEVMLGISGRF